MNERKILSNGKDSSRPPKTILMLLGIVEKQLDTGKNKLCNR